MCSSDLKSITITSANSASYLQALGDGTTGNDYRYNIRLDGSLGGEKIQRVILDVDIPSTRPIAGFNLPNIISGESATCYLEIATSRTVFIDDSIGDMGSAIR
jgi:hypothetical protein